MLKKKPALFCNDIKNRNLYNGKNSNVVFEIREDRSLANVKVFFFYQKVFCKRVMSAIDMLFF